MSMNVNTIFSSNEFLKYPQLKTLISDVIKRPGEEKVKIVQRYKQVNTKTSPKVNKISVLVSKIWHKICFKFSKGYRTSFQKAVATIQLSLKQDAAALKAQRVFRGHRVRKQLKQAKESEKKKRLALSVQTAIRSFTLRKQLTETHQKIKEKAALENLQRIRTARNACHEMQVLADNVVRQKQQRISELDISIAALTKYQIALTNFNSAKERYDRFYNSRMKVIQSWVWEDRLVTEARTVAKLNFDNAEKELNEANTPLVRSVPQGDIASEIQKLKKNKTDLEVSIVRLNKIKALANVPRISAQLVPNLPLNIPAVPPAQNLQSAQQVQIQPPSPQTTPPTPQVNSTNPSAVASPSNPAYDISQLRSPRGLMLSSIAAFIHKDLKLVWDEMFKKCDPQSNKILSWNCDERGNFQIKLSHPIKMWVPSTNEQGQEDPKGGVVLMLGEPDGIISGNLDRGTKTMNFAKGFHVHCQYVVLMKEIPITPQVFRLVYENRDRVLFGAGLELFGKKFFKDRVKSIEYLLTNWGANGEVVASDHEGYIRRKRQH